MNAAELHPLLPASDWWLVAAAGAVVCGICLVGWPLLARLWAAQAGPAGVPTAVPAHTRREYLGRIDAVEARWHAGTLGSRQVAQELGTIVRDFAQAAWGLQVTHMTLAELRAHRVEPIAQAVSRLYDAEFSTTATADSPAELAEARKLVARWS